VKKDMNSPSDLLAPDDLLAAEPEDGDEPSRRDQVHQAGFAACPACARIAGPEEARQFPLEAFVLGPFQPVELDRLDAVKDLVQPGGEARGGLPAFERGERM
jgi:hypothetical protein